MSTTVSMKSIGEKLVNGPCLRISASRKENKTRNLPHSLADWDQNWAMKILTKELTSERQNWDLAKLILTADQINLHLLQCIAQIDQFVCIYKSKLL